MKHIYKRIVATCLAALLCLTTVPLGAAAAEPGDVNGDGSITMADALRVFYHVNGKLTLTGDRLAAADLSGNGKVLMQDALLIFYKASNMDAPPLEPEPEPEPGPEPEPEPDPTPAHVSVRAGVTNESVYMNDIRVKNETTGKTFTAETKEKLQMAVAEIVKYEMGMSTFGEKSNEAWKAMAVAAYTEIAHYCYGEGDRSYTYSISMSEDIDLTKTTDKRIYDAVGEVLGIKIAYNNSSLSAFNQLCEVFYGASSAGVTCSTLNVWGYTNLEYIPVVESAYDNTEWIAHCSAGIDSFEHTFTIPISELIECIAEEKGVAVSKVGYDKKAGEYSLYATEKEGPYWAYSNFYYTNSSGKKVYISGVDLYFAINNCHPTIHCYSHAITVTAEKNGLLTITTKGNGHGLGMSQYGAAGYANEAGWTYDQILAHYYGITDTTAWGLVGPKW